MATLDSPIRAQAIMLDVLAEVNENHPSIPMLVENLSEAASEGNRWTTTQENAFAFLALGKILKKQMDKKLHRYLDTQRWTFCRLRRNGDSLHR